ncbi:MAG: 4-phosphoerythronate dehydrogenase [Alloprevotella sp.]
MFLLIDAKIPYMRGLAERLGRVRYVNGADITPEDVREADVLIVRTRTRCDRRLLEGSRVKFIATATIGYDHLDTAYLAQRRIGWANCPGCNAGSVGQYVECVLLLLAAHGCWNDGPLLPAEVPATKIDTSVFKRLTLGIVGVGHVGTEVLRVARRLGFGRVLLCDPPRAEREGGTAWATLDEVARECDVVSFHTPLTPAAEPHGTFHLAGERFFAQLKRGAVVLNTSRGEVVDTAALKAALDGGSLRTAVIDTWENEPQIDRELLQRVFLGTPHIAGYSADGKANGTRMALQAVARHFGLDDAFCRLVAPPDLPPDFSYLPKATADITGCEALRLYDPTRDSMDLKAHPEQFEMLRGNYPLRREIFFNV